ncbi:hypothetical protein IV203_034211 [Nitzschia inconspicua]|uniref:Uncharacterized protein n=1 Tax=Nitzschia inconspicua TaxID=303405 RepID=A0A9K3M3X0_9STRA|nr:hypothetical protein IV203_034211 [Nitzschia inconspicua]
MSSQTMFVQANENRLDKENAMAEQPVLKQARPRGSNGGNRNKSRNERILSGGSMKDSSRQKAACSLCCIAGHRVGRNCPVVKEHKAQVIWQRETSIFAHRLGNPEHHLVQRAGKSTRENIKQWVTSPQEIPDGCKHMVLKRCFFPAKDGASFDFNIVEVDLLDEPGGKMTGFCNAYYPAHKVRTWIEGSCKLGRAKHLLSALGERYRRKCTTFRIALMPLKCNQGLYMELDVTSENCCYPLPQYFLI